MVIGGLYPRRVGEKGGKCYFEGSGEFRAEEEVWIYILEYFTESNRVSVQSHGDELRGSLQTILFSSKAILFDMLSNFLFSACRAFSTFFWNFTRVSHSQGSSSLQMLI